MADYTNNLNIILPGDDDYALVENLTDDFQAIDAFAGDVVKVYDPTTTHSKREYCIYQDHLYKCNSFITQPEAFDPSKWDRVILGDEVRNNNSYITNLQSGLAIVQDGDTATKAITQGQYVIWKGSMRYAKANIAIGETLSSTNLGTVTYEGGSLNRLSEQIGNLVSKQSFPNIVGDGTAKEISLTITMQPGYNAYIFAMSSNQFDSSHYIHFWNQPNASGQFYVEHNLSSTTTVTAYVMWIPQ